MVSNESATTMNLGTAVRYCNALTEATFSDWHLPSFDELLKVLSTGGVSVSNNASTNYVWFLPNGVVYYGGDYYGTTKYRFSDGFISGSYLYNPGNLNYVRCVR